MGQHAGYHHGHEILPARPLSAAAGTLAAPSMSSLTASRSSPLELTPENNDLFHQYVFKSINASQPSSVQLTFEGSGSLAYQVVGRSFTPWEARPASEALSIELRYDRTQLKQDDIATATATIHNNTRANEKMIMVDLGIPPGFELMSEDLQSFEEKSSSEHSGKLQKFSLTAYAGHPLLRRPRAQSDRLLHLSPSRPNTPFAPAPLHPAFTSTTTPR